MNFTDEDLIMLNVPRKEPYEPPLGREAGYESYRKIQAKDIRIEEHNQC